MDDDTPMVGITGYIPETMKRELKSRLDLLGIKITDFIHDSAKTFLETTAPTKEKRVWFSGKPRTRKKAS